MKAFLTFAILLAMTLITNAQDQSVCGPAPIGSTEKIIAESSRKALDAKAQILAKMAGSAGIEGAIDSTRQEIYRTTTKDEATLHDRYLAYVTCLLVMKDDKASLKEKAELVRQLQKPVSSTAPRSRLFDQFLNDFERDTTMEKVREMLGAPSGRSKINFTESRQRRTYSLERYESETATIYIIGDKPIRGIAVQLTEYVPTTSLTIPYYPAFGPPTGDHDAERLGELTLNSIRNCRGKLQEPDARFVYVKAPACSHGAAGGSNYFIFGFYAGAALDTCKFGPWDIKGAQFEKIDCQHFWQYRPHFVLVYLNDDLPSANAMSDAVLRYAYWRHRGTL